MPAFGLDISDTFIRLAMLDKRRHHWRLSVRAEIPVTSGWIIDGEIQNPQRVSQLLGELLRAAGIRQRQAFVSLPERYTFVKLITIAPDRLENLEQAVHDETAHHLPYSVDEVYFDWQVLPQPDSHGQTRVLIGAAPRAQVDTYMSVLNAAEIEPLGLEVESLAIARATIEPAKNTGARIVLDLGRTRSTLILVQDGAVLFSATVRYAGRELNKYIADELKITAAQAERAKRIFGLDPARGKGLLRRVLAPQLDILVNKINEVEDFYAANIIDHQPISQILLTGSGALLRNIDHELAVRLSRPVGLQPAWLTRELNARHQNIDAEIGYTYATAFGLALLNYPSL